jgi:signal transduction histidine kinase
LADPKELVASAIAKAQSSLEVALGELEKLPAFDAGSVAYAAHALNNYLTVTGGTVELILAYLGDHADAQLRVWLEGAQHATNLMVRIVGQLMNSAAPTETLLRLEEFDLPTLVQRACSYYQRVAGRKKMRLTADDPVAVPPVWADRVQVAAVLDNLLSNAVKYSPPGKQIWVQVRGEKEWATCSVRDEGPGLSQEDQTRLFQRGVRLTPRPTGDESSTGYGLAVAKELIERLGGTIWCESVLGQGACFSFRLPANPEQTRGAKQESPGARLPSGEAGRTDSST